MPLNLFHEQRTDPPAAELGLDREGLEFADPLSGVEAPIALPNSEERESDRSALALGDQQPGFTGSHPALVQRPSPLPGLLRSPERDSLARRGGNLGIVLVHRPP